MKPKKIIQRERRHRRIRARMRGTAEKPRLVAHRSLKYHYANLVDDVQKKILLGVTDRNQHFKGKKSDRAKELGKLIAKKAIEKGIQTCVFDRGGYKYHGRLKAIAEGAREGGLKF